MKEDPEQNTVLVTMVTENASKYSNADHAWVLLAHKVQKIIGCPSTQDFIKIVENNILPNCPLSCQDTMVAEHIFGPDLGYLLTVRW